MYYKKVDGNNLADTRRGVSQLEESIVHKMPDMMRN